MSGSPRAENILRHVNILDTLLKLEVVEDTADTARNIPCPFHNFGRERKPSGRVYTESDKCVAGHFYCFTCQKVWNPIDFVMEYRQMSFPSAMRWLEDRFKVPPLKVDDFLPQAKPEPQKGEVRTESELAQTLKYADNLLRGLRGAIPVATFRLLCDITDTLYVKARTPNEEACRQVDSLLAKLKTLGRRESFDSPVIQHGS